ncbi:hypothetical protein B0H17DRAFT_1247008 [Mycena rosella]|uniref:Uncharacterized protein n=1 Tax=Mycena rosella TaxID=1033263 RepID=A0AAD7G894_MYCRO|nr:hypothetical protein B0H17DRAFT_1247008 [Mycena rosella]
MASVGPLPIKCHEPTVMALARSVKKHLLCPLRSEVGPAASGGTTQWAQRRAKSSTQWAPAASSKGVCGGLPRASISEKARASERAPCQREKAALANGWGLGDSRMGQLSSFHRTPESKSGVLMAASFGNRWTAGSAFCGVREECRAEMPGSADPGFTQRLAWRGQEIFWNWRNNGDFSGLNPRPREKRCNVQKTVINSYTKAGKPLIKSHSHHSRIYSSARAARGARTPDAAAYLVTMMPVPSHGALQAKVADTRRAADSAARLDAKETPHTFPGPSPHPGLSVPAARDPTHVVMCRVGLGSGFEARPRPDPR